MSVSARGEGDMARAVSCWRSPVGLAGAGVPVTAWCLHSASPPALVLQHGRQLSREVHPDVSPAQLPWSPGFF